MILFTSGAVFYASDKFGCAAAVLKEIERAVAEEAVLIIKPVTWIIFTINIGKMFIAQHKLRNRTS